LIQDETQKNETLDRCPHCGHALSLWQQVLLSVDRALVCKNCWYRIILDIPLKEEPPVENNSDKTKPEG
jgi:DNA-directed RNA polymerase subunit RPC12/RpoP